MTLLEKYVAKWLEREGRIPDDALLRLPEELAADIESRADLERIADRIAGSRPDLANRRRVVTSLRARVKAEGGLTREEFDELVRRARSTGWGPKDIERLIDETRASLALPPWLRETSADTSAETSPKPPPPERLPRQDPEPHPERSDGSVSPPAADEAQAETKRARNPQAIVLVGILATFGLVAFGIAGAFWLAGTANPESGRDARIPTATDGVPGNHIAEAQQLLNRLGPPVPVTGVYDDATRDALERALPEYAGLKTLEPWLTERLRAALDEADQAQWQAAREAASIEAVSAYLERFPEGRYAAAARDLMTVLEAADERTEILLAIQRELDRLGRQVDETGELDQQTLDAFEGFTGPMPILTRTGLRETLDALKALPRWPVADGETFRDCLVCPQMVAIPAGRFLMGSPLDERMRMENEGPQREVFVPRFAMSRTEVTYGEWLPCVADGVCVSVPEPEGEDWLEVPVTQITWTDALDYMRWLRERTGIVYRMPTEAQWEYAARAGTTTRFHTGDCISSEQANYDARLASAGCPAGPRSEGVRPVASFPPNAFGLYDMLGNALEPTRDCWNPTYDGAPTDGSAWETGDCSRAPYRGGSWRSSDRELRSAARIRPGGVQRSEVIGLRLTTDLGAPPPRR